MTLLSMYSRIKGLMLQEEGQDLVEYALVLALVALAATAGMNTLANDINNAFTTVGGMLTSDI